ncbi:hypothetical protein LEP1GSC168_0793 [Leptospira santarosai str. HAI134]|nr:hypothetical protein LEP1GSC168_0793 [Leptospira santarosai str. HAI134]
MLRRERLRRGIGKTTYQITAIPVGGQRALRFLGFGILLILNFLGHNPPGNRIFIDPADQEFSAAYQSGLRTGDRILNIDESNRKIRRHSD